MMKPFGWHNQTEPERIFNYILSRARRIENGEMVFRCMNVSDIVHGNHATAACKHQREYLKLYYISPAGAVLWQQKMI